MFPKNFKCEYSIEKAAPSIIKMTTEVWLLKSLVILNQRLHNMIPTKEKTLNFPNFKNDFKNSFRKFFNT